MKRTLLSLGLLYATTFGWAQTAPTEYHSEDLKALESFVKLYPDYEYMVNYWDDMMYYEDVKMNDRFGVKWADTDGVKRIVKFQLNNTIEDQKSFETLDLNSFTALSEIVIKSAGVRQVNAANVASLAAVELTKNELESFDFPVTINSLTLYENQTFTNGDFSKYTSLVGLYMNHMPLREVKIGSPELMYLTAQSMPLESVDLEIAKSKLNRVDLSGCPLSGVTFDGFDNLEFLTLENCGLTSLPVANLKVQMNLSVSENSIEHLDLSDLPLVKSLGALNCGVKKVTFSAESVALGNINLSNNLIESIDVSGWNFQSSPTGMLRLSNNPLTNFVTHPNLKQLYLTSCKLATLDVSASTLLTALDCKYNQLTFQTLKTPKYNSRFALSPQDSILVAKREGDYKYLNPGDLVDLSFYVSPEGAVTSYEWYKLEGSGFEITDAITPGSETGKFNMPENFPGTYYCKVKTTTPTIKNMYLVTEKFELGSASSLNRTASSVNIYPNPVSDRVVIKGCNNNQIDVYDPTGVLVYTAVASVDQLEINTSGWNKGLYVVRIGEQIHKLIKK